MARNRNGARVGFIRDRVQLFNPKVRRWVKIDTKNGTIVAVKKDHLPWKGVRKAKQKRLRLLPGEQVTNLVDPPTDQTPA